MIILKGEVLVMKKKILIFHIIFFANSLQAIDMTISKPGIYTLGNFIVSRPAGSTSIINIISSDVVLDLNGYVVSQGNATASVDGIAINSGLTDIIIKNGTIRSLTG